MLRPSAPQQATRHRGNAQLCRHPPAHPPAHPPTRPLARPPARYSLARPPCACMRARPLACYHRGRWHPHALGASWQRPCDACHPPPQLDVVAVRYSAAAARPGRLCLAGHPVDSRSVQAGRQAPTWWSPGWPCAQGAMSGGGDPVGWARCWGSLHWGGSPIIAAEAAATAADSCKHHHSTHTRKERTSEVIGGMHTDGTISVSRQDRGIQSTPQYRPKRKGHIAHTASPSPLLSCSQPVPQSAERRKLAGTISALRAT